MHSGPANLLASVRRTRSNRVLHRPLRRRGRSNRTPVAAAGMEWWLAGCCVRARGENPNASAAAVAASVRLAGRGNPRRVRPAAGRGPAAAGPRAGLLRRRGTARHAGPADRVGQRPRQAGLRAPPREPRPGRHAAGQRAGAGPVPRTGGGGDGTGGGGQRDHAEPPVDGRRRDDRRRAGRVVPAGAADGPPVLAHVFGCSMHHYLLRDWLAPAGSTPTGTCGCASCPRRRWPGSWRAGTSTGSASASPGTPPPSGAAGEGRGGHGRRAARPPRKSIGRQPRLAGEARRRRRRPGPRGAAGVRLLPRPGQRRPRGRGARPTGLPGPACRTCWPPASPAARRPNGDPALTFPSPTHAAWLLGQMARWGHLPADTDTCWTLPAARSKPPRTARRPRRWGSPARPTTSRRCAPGKGGSTRRTQGRRRLFWPRHHDLPRRAGTARRSARKCVTLGNRGP